MQVDALQAERDSLSVQLEEASRRAQFAESVTSGLAARLDSREALRTLDDAMQVCDAMHMSTGCHISSAGV